MALYSALLIGYPRIHLSNPIPNRSTWLVLRLALLDTLISSEVLSNAICSSALLYAYRIVNSLLKYAS